MPDRTFTEIHINLFAVTLPRYGINVKFIDPTDPENFRTAITDRTKAVFGETIGNPGLQVLDIEAVAGIAHEAGVIGKPDAVRGEIVKAFIVLREGFEQSSDLLEETRSFVRNNLAAHAAPKEIEIMELLHKATISGKILWRELKRREMEKSKISGV